MSCLVALVSAAWLSAVPLATAQPTYLVVEIVPGAPGATGTRWAVAEGEVGGVRAHETYLLIANTSAFAGNATVTLMFEDGTSAVTSYPLPRSSRTNVPVGPAFGATVTGKRFGAVIESTGTMPAQIVVERAKYSSRFAGGTNALATRLQ